MLLKKQIFHCKTGRDLFYEEVVFPVIYQNRLFKPTWAI